MEYLDKPFDERAKDDEGKAILNGDRESKTHKSLLVCSNLRRAIATAVYVRGTGQTLLVARAVALSAR